MNRRTESTRRPHADPRGSAAHARSEPTARRLLGEIVRGCLLGGAGFLLGSCPLLLGTAPLGIALLSAASAYIWYIFGGLLLAALLHPVILTGWAWVGVYAFCLILRLCIRFFVDPPSLPDGRPCGAGTYLRLCWRSFKRNIGLSDDEADDTDPRHGRSRRADDDDAPPPMGTRPREIRLFAEHPFLRILTAAVSGFAAGVFGMLTGGFHVYDLLRTLLLLVSAPLGAFLLVSCFGEAGLVLLFSASPLRDAPGRKKPLRGKAYSDRDGGMGRLIALFHILPLVSVSALLVAVVYGARTYSPAGLGLPLFPEPAMLLGLLFSLFAASRLGVVPGVAAGVLCGLAADPRSAPIFILCAGGYALLRGLSHQAGVIGGCTIGAVWCAVIEGTPSLIRHLPSLILVVPLYLVIEKLWQALPPMDGQAHADREVEDFTNAMSAAMAAETRAEAQRARLTALSEAFGGLSRHFRDLSGQLKTPRMGDVRRMCDEAFGKQCAHCRHREVCWGTEYHRTLDAESALSDRLLKTGQVHADDLPEALSDFCPYMEAIVEDLNHRYAHLCESLSHHEKTEAYADSYAAMAALLGDALESDRIEAETMGGNRETADRIYDYLTGEGVTVQGVVVAGKQESGRRRVIVRGEGDGLKLLTAPEREEDLRETLEDICGTRLSRPVLEEVGDTATVMTLEPEARLRPRFSGSTVPAGHPAREPLPSPLTHDTPPGGYAPPAVCGDHVALFHAGSAYFYALISDGMGSGEDASLTSEICTMFLEKMLAAGNRAEISLRMLDGYIHAKNTGSDSECSATVDLMELDLVDGRAVFAKNGAAPTYVVRDGTVYKLRSRSLPIGILKDTDPEFLRFRMHPGDVVVMVSDGITQGHDECAWLIDLLSSPIPDNMDALRRDIIRRALSAGSEDDLSAVAIRVEEQVS